MVKALFLDMDETLCDTQGANKKAQALLAQAALQAAPGLRDSKAFAQAYLDGIYRRWSDAQQARYLPIAEREGEEAFRVLLIQDLFALQQITELNPATAVQLQHTFDRDRLQAFDYYPGIRPFLKLARPRFKLVVITNGPEYSQLPKIEAVKLGDYVDHIIVGGQEPAQKPAQSIFSKALNLAACSPSEAIHIGDNLEADIAGANNSGISSVWIQHDQDLGQNPSIKPKYILAHPSDIPSFIEGLKLS